METFVLRAGTLLTLGVALFRVVDVRRSAGVFLIFISAGVPPASGAIEVGHVHFQDVPDEPRELLDNTTRFIPGDGVSPLTTILRKLADKGYAGALSVELFLPRFQQGDPFEVASEIRRKAEAVMRQARVL